MAELGVDKRSTRSRSKTPSIIASENGNSDKKAKKIPTISLIEEEDDIVEILSQPGKKRPRRSAKAPTSDTSPDVSAIEVKSSQKETASSRTSVFTTTTVTETVKKSTNGESSAAASTTTTTNVTKFGTEVPENQSIFNNIFNAIKTSTPILANKRTKRVTETINSSLPVNGAEHPAYKEYKDAGEYWNKYPKTDYTYSELSPHRRELSNGVVAMPNMSRRSLEKYQYRVEAMIQNNPLDESFIRRKFLSTSNTSFQKRSADLQYDSADEVDVSEFRRQLAKNRNQSGTIFSRFWLTLVTFFSSIKESTRSVFYRSSNKRYVYTPIRKQNKGIAQRAFESVRRLSLLVFSKIYITVSTILCLDTWILYTRSENHVQNQRRRRFLLLLLILLPLLLLTAWLLSDENFTDAVKLEHITHKFQSMRLVATESLTSLRLPEMPSLPSLPSFSFNFSLGSLWLPFISLGSGIKSFLFTKSPKEELKMTLDEKTLQILFSHIDRHVQETISLQLNEHSQKLTKEIENRLMVVMFETIKKEVVSYEYKLTAEDIERIVAAIKSRIDSEFDEKEKLLIAKIAKLNDKSFVAFGEQLQNKLNLPVTSSGGDDAAIELLRGDLLKHSARIEEILRMIDDSRNEAGENAKKTADLSAQLTALVSDIEGLRSHSGESIKTWITSLLLARDADLEKRFVNVEANSERAFHVQLDKTKNILIDDTSEEIKKQVAGVMASLKGSVSGGGLSEADVLKIVQAALRVYDADKTGLVDYALESSGGQVISTRCTQNYKVKSAEISVFGIPLWWLPANSPRTVISPAVHPGECWAFEGFPGYLVVKLNNMVQVTGFTLEHLSQSLAPNGIIDSAPNNFTVWGLTTEMDTDPVLFGEYHFSADKGDPSLQYFPVKNSEKFQPYQIIEIKIESNHGNPKYTCVYRFRVHGILLQ